MYMGVKLASWLAEICVTLGWNYEITAAIVETCIILIIPTAIMALMLFQKGESDYGCGRLYWWINSFNSYYISRTLSS